MRKDQQRQRLALKLLILAQFFCVVYFFMDVAVDFRAGFHIASDRLHIIVELIASCVLAITIGFEVWLLRRLTHQADQLTERLEDARLAVEEIIEKDFACWGLTQSEHEVALLAVKGFNTHEIAQMRGSAEGTVKAHLNAIYRKSGAKSRADLTALILDQIMGERPPHHTD